MGNELNEQGRAINFRILENRLNEQGRGINFRISENQLNEQGRGRGRGRARRRTYTRNIDMFAMPRPSNESPSNESPSDEFLDRLRSRMSHMSFPAMRILEEKFISLIWEFCPQLEHLKLSSCDSDTMRKISVNVVRSLYTTDIYVNVEILFVS